MYGQQGNPYQANAVNTAGPAQLVLMCYDGALDAISRARYAEATPERVNTEIQRAQDLVTELLVGLDFERGGQISPRLASLYRYCLDELLQANLSKDPGTRLDGVVSVLTGLRETWQEIAATPALRAG